MQDPPTGARSRKTAVAASPPEPVGAGSHAALRDHGLELAAETSSLSRDEILAYYARTGYSLAHHPAHLLRRAHQRATATFQVVMAGDELTPTQHAALAVVLKYESLSQNHLGRLTAMDPSTVSLVVRALTKRGLLVRRPSETDQRMAMIALTDDGVRYALERLDSSMEVARRVLRPLSASEQATFLDLLRRVIDADEPSTPNGP